MEWEVQFHAAFEAEVLAIEREVRIALIASTRLLSDYGPQLGRPHADTLKGSKHANMKELRFEAADGESRAAFAFDPERRAIMLVAGDKSGGSQKRFYRQLIAKADLRFSDTLCTVKMTQRYIIKFFHRSNIYVINPTYRKHFRIKGFRAFRFFAHIELRRN